MFGDEQFRRLPVVTADLIYAECDSLVFISVFTFNYQYRDAVDEKDHIFPRAVMAVVKGPLFGDLKNISRWVVVINQDKVALAVLLLVKKLAPVAQVIDEFPVAVDVGVQVVKLVEQRALLLSIKGIEFPYLGVEQVVEVERGISVAIGGRRIRIKPAPLLGLIARHKCPANILCVFKNTGLDGFVFGGGGHEIQFKVRYDSMNRQHFGIATQCRDSIPLHASCLVEQQLRRV